MSNLLDKLKDPFDPKFLKWRVGATNKEKTKGIALAYLDAREVMKRLDDVCGIDGWQCRHIETSGGFICEIDLRVDDKWITRSNAAGNTKVEPVKGGASDAFKRAAAVWGVGRYLYYLPNEWVEIEAYGNSYTLAETPPLPKWALPGSFSNDDAETDAAKHGAVGADADDSFLDDNGDTNSEKVLDAIKKAKGRKDLEGVMAKLSASEQRAYASAIRNRVKELSDGTKN